MAGHPTVQRYTSFLSAKECIYCTDAEPARKTSSLIFAVERGGRGVFYFPPIATITRAKLVRNEIAFHIIATSPPHGGETVA
jgi:hypothetical protein